MMIQMKQSRAIIFLETTRVKTLLLTASCVWYITHQLQTSASLHSTRYNSHHTACVFDFITLRIKNQTQPKLFFKLLMFYGSVNVEVAPFQKCQRLIARNSW